MNLTVETLRRGHGHPKLFQGCYSNSVYKPQSNPPNRSKLRHVTTEPIRRDVLCRQRLAINRYYTNYTPSTPSEGSMSVTA